MLTIISCIAGQVDDTNAKISRTISLSGSNGNGSSKPPKRTRLVLSSTRLPDVVPTEPGKNIASTKTVKIPETPALRPLLVPTQSLATKAGDGANSNGGSKTGGGADGRFIKNNTAVGTTNLLPEIPAGDIMDESEPEATLPASVTELTRRTRLPKATTPPPIERSTTPPLPGTPLQGFFFVNAKDVTCIIVNAAARFTFTYFNKMANKTEQAQTDLPRRNYTVDGNCGDQLQRMSILFSPLKSDMTWNLTMTWKKNTSSPEFFVDSIKLDFVLKEGSLPFPWASSGNGTATYNGTSLFRSPSDKSFLCMSASRISAFETRSTNNVELSEIMLRFLQIEAFRQVNATVLSSNVVQCQGDFVSNTIPLAVGITVLILILSVLVVYIVFRMKGGDKKDYKAVDSGKT
jgi:hypothetical protein